MSLNVFTSPNYWGDFISRYLKALFNLHTRLCTEMAGKHSIKPQKSVVDASGSTNIPIRSMYGIFTYIYPKTDPFMYVNIPAPWFASGIAMETTIV